jgi:hypothetical protein
VRRQMVLFRSGCWSAAPAGIRSFVVPVRTPHMGIENKDPNKESNCRSTLRLLGNSTNTSFHRGLITLLFKSGKMEHLGNQCPITSLNVSYKIFANALQLRLQPLLMEMKYKPNQFPHALICLIYNVLLV